MYFTKVCLGIIGAPYRDIWDTFGLATAHLSIEILSKPSTPQQNKLDLCPNSVCAAQKNENPFWEGLIELIGAPIRGPKKKKRMHKRRWGIGFNKVLYTYLSFLWHRFYIHSIEHDSCTGHGRSGVITPDKNHIRIVSPSAPPQRFAHILSSAPASPKRAKPFTNHDFGSEEASFD